jgi:hypothetical protein
MTPRPLFSGHRLGLPPRDTASASSVKTFSKLYHPARSLGPLRFEAAVTCRPARADLPGGGLLPGQDLHELSVSTHSCSPATFRRL